MTLIYGSTEYGLHHEHTMTALPSQRAKFRQAEHQSARMSKITNDGLTRSGTGCFIAVPK